MRLITRQGELVLPRDLTFEVTRNNPFLSEEGDATYPAELPATPDNLRVMGIPNRIDNASRPFLKQSTILYAGAFQLRGTLMMSAADRSTVTTALAIDNGDLWTNYGDKMLQEIVGDGNLISFNNMTALMAHVNSVNEPSTYKFPVVAVAKYENGKGVTIYQMNNEPDLTSTNTGAVPFELVYGERFVQDKGNTVSVPDGYGIAPQMLLHAALEAIFAAMDYTVTESIFNETPWNRILLLNNTSDAACKLRFKLSEMLPTCTLSELVSFLKNKFHVHVLADSASKTVRIVRMEDVLSPSNTPDIDISPLLDGSWAFDFHNTSRIVLSDDLSLDGAAPAKETVAAMEDKYSSCQPVTEAEYVQLNNYQHPELHMYFDCLILRKATGEYYRLVHDLNNGSQVVERLGTNAMTYDRQNSDETEAFAAADLFAPMVDLGNGILAPYVGERLHYNTHLTTDTDTDADNSEQKIIVAWYIGMQKDDDKQTYRMASTQHYDATGAAAQSISTDLTPLGLYNDFWKRYNRILLNGKIEVEGRVCYPMGMMQSINMTRTKLFNGQRLFPVSMHYAIGGKTVCGMSRFMNLKEYADMVDDSTNLFGLPEHRFKWVWQKPGIDQFVEENSWTDDSNPGIDESQSVTWQFTDGASGTVWLDQPTAAGLIAHRLIRYVTYHVHYIREDIQYGQILEEREWDVTERVETWFESEAV